MNLIDSATVKSPGKLLEALRDMQVSVMALADEVSLITKKLARPKKNKSVKIGK